MGNSILEEVWYGNINPQEQCSEKSKAVKDLLKLMGRNRDRLNDAITEQQRETLEKYDDCINEMHCIMVQEILPMPFVSAGNLCLRC